jgi:hypothetical protein
MNKPTLPVTTALRQVIKEVSPETECISAYSDERNPEPAVKAVGVKILFRTFSEDQINQIVEGMKQRGYTFHYQRPNTYGHRFCFSI